MQGGLVTRKLSFRLSSVRLSVRPSVKRVHCHKKKKVVPTVLYHTKDHLP